MARPASFDEQARAYVEPMALTAAEKALRAQMIAYMADRLSRIKEVDRDRYHGAELLLLLSARAMLIRTVIIETSSRFFLPLVTLNGGRTVSDFSRAYIDRFAEEAAVFKNESDPFSRAASLSAPIAGAAQTDAFYQKGVRKKRWCTERDSRVRPTHRSAEGQIRLIEEPFQVGGYLLMFPGDTSLGAPASETANCRCAMKEVRG